MVTVGYHLSGFIKLVAKVTQFIYNIHGLIIMKYTVIDYGVTIVRCNYVAMVRSEFHYFVYSCIAYGNLSATILCRQLSSLVNG